MRCSKCGRNNPNDAAFCGRCGTKVQHAFKAVSNPQHQYKWAFFIFGSLVFVLLLSVIGYKLINHNNRQNDSHSAAIIGTNTNKVPLYELIEVGKVFPRAINDKSQVLAQSDTPSDAVLWQNGKTVYTGLGNINDGRMFLNNNGTVIVGRNFQPSAVLWQDGRITDLSSQPNFPRPTNLSVLDLNNNDQILVDGDYTSGEVTGSGNAIWKAGQLIPIPELNSMRSGAINNRGVVVGVSHDAFAIWQNGKKTDLGVGANDLVLHNQTGGSLGIGKVALNDNNQVVGTWLSKPNDKSNKPHAYIWQTGEINDLGVLPGDDRSTAEAINDEGQVVGKSSKDSISSSNDAFNALLDHAFLWQNGQMYDLSKLVPTGYSLMDATGINDKGQIIAFAKHNNQFVGVLLTPK